MRLFKPSTVAAFALWSATALGQADFGQQWVRSHPYTLMALQRDPNPAISKYGSANLNTMLAWQDGGYGRDIAIASQQSGLPWQALILDGQNSRYTNFSPIMGSTGWVFGDELSRQSIVSSFTTGGFYATQKNLIRAARPNDLIYTQMWPTYASPTTRYGGAPPGGVYTYAQYLNDVVNYAQPDVLMYDHYPFPSGSTRTADFFDNLMQVRNKGLASNLPYWAFAQSFQSNALGYREPSSSDVRMQVFSHATAGYTGIAYFTFDDFGDKSMLDANGIETTIYPKVQSVDLEMRNLGAALRFLTSDDVKFIRGSRNQNGSVTLNPVPTGLTTWTAANDSDDHILSIAMDNLGSERNGLLGNFTDDNGNAAFMIQNLHHGANVNSSSVSAATGFTIQFDDSISTLVRLDRLTGHEVLVPLTDNRLTISIPAGTAELFRYSGAFLVAPPSPADFNHDNLVDQADLALWTADVGHGDGGDADNDGDSDGADFLAWQRSFRPGVAPSPGVGVPEPDSLVLFALATLAMRYAQGRSALAVRGPRRVFRRRLKAEL